MLWLFVGLAIILSGIVVLVLGSMWGIVLLFGGVGVMSFNYVTMMRGRGMEPNQGTINGINGQGKQQSEAVSISQPVIGEQPTNIWDQMTNKEKNS